MVAYKDILNTFWWDTSYADRFQAAALKWDQAWMSDIIREYKWVWTSTPPTTPTTPTTPTPIQGVQGDSLGNWNYQDDSADRQDQIVSNLNEAYQQNPDQFKDWATFSQNFNYDTAWRSDKQKETMRNWYSQMQQNSIDYNDVNNTDYFFNQLMSGSQLSWQWAALDAARNRYKNYQYLSGMTPDQIASAIASNSINPVWQEMQDLKNYSPALYAQVQSAMQWQTQVNDINALWEWIYNWLTNTETNKNYTNYNFTTEYAKNASVIKQYNESLYKKIEWLGWDTAAYVAIVASMLQNPLIQANKDEVENLEWEIRKIQENIYTVWDTARSRLWSEAPEDLVSAYISQQTKNLQNQLRTAQNSLLVAQGKLNNQLTEVETMIDAINNWLEMQAKWVLWTPTEVIDMTSTTPTSSRWGWYQQPTTQPQDTYNYQDDSNARLKEIASNLNSLYNSNPELFKDRATFDNYFKYNQRSPKQKALLDAFFTQKKWILASAWRWLWWTWTGTTTSEDGLVNAIKKDLISRTVNFTSSTMKDTYWKKYQQAKSWDEDTTNDYLQEIWKISSLSEMKTMLSHLSKDANKKALLSSLKPKVISELQTIKNKTDRSNKFKEYANKLWLDPVTLANLRGIKVN